MGGIQRTLADFHSECDEWDQHLDALLAEIDVLAAAGSDDEQGGRSVPLEEGRIVNEVSDLRHVVEKQIDLFANLLSRVQLAPASLSEPVVTQVLEQLNEIQDKA
jgi:hypothetical protein